MLNTPFSNFCARLSYSSYDSFRQVNAACSPAFSSGRRHALAVYSTPAGLSYVSSLYFLFGITRSKHPRSYSVFLLKFYPSLFPKTKVRCFRFLLFFLETQRGHFPAMNRKTKVDVTRLLSYIIKRGITTRLVCSDTAARKLFTDKARA